MNDSRKKLTEEELKLIEETERFMEEVNSDPEIANVTAPPELKEKVFAEIRKKESEKEEQELIRLGRIYKKKRKATKYIVFAAAAICVLAFGITSVGGPEVVFERIKYAVSGRDRINVDSQNEDVEPIDTTTEEEAYQEIKDAFGVCPVKLYYLPEKVELLYADIMENSQGATLIYGENEQVKINYIIRPNYRTGSLGADIEDELLEEQIKENEHTTFYMRKYLVDGEEERWIIQFEYQDVTYFLQLFDTSEKEVIQISDNLYFP